MAIKIPTLAKGKSYDKKDRKAWAKKILDRAAEGQHIQPWVLYCALEVAGDGPAPRNVEAELATMKERMAAASGGMVDTKHFRAIQTMAVMVNGDLDSKGLLVQPPKA